jgi:molybdate transport system regulatory protein
MRERVRISIADRSGAPFMGIGLVWLLRRVEKFGSIRGAAEDMGMSYVKALGILGRLETKLRRKVLIRRRGGAQKGGAELTPFAKEFIAKYDRYQKVVARCAKKQFAAIFGAVGR